MSLRSEVRLEKVVRGCHMGRMDTRHGDKAANWFIQLAS